MALAVNVLKEQIEKAKENLKNVDEDIKKITGRDPNEPRPNIEGRRQSTGTGTGRGRIQGSILGRRASGTQNRSTVPEPPVKKPLKNQVFARLGPAGGRRVVISGRRDSFKEQQEEEDDEEEEDEVAVKPAVQSSVFSTAKKITKSELISAQNVGEKGKARNRRMFGVLLGTLARFQNDSGSAGQQTKQAVRQKEIERRLEEQSLKDRKQLASQRRTLFTERRAQQKRIQLLEQKVALADELLEWEKEWMKKSSFIMTKASPAVFFLPKEYNAPTERALKESKKRIQDIIEKNRKSMEETMKMLDDEIKMLENKPDQQQDGKGGSIDHTNGVGAKDLKGVGGGRKAEEAEEEMDLDSMGPQVDIKVEMDDTEGGEEGKGAEGENIEMEESEVVANIKQELEEQISNDPSQKEKNPDAESAENTTDLSQSVDRQEDPSETACDSPETMETEGEQTAQKQTETAETDDPNPYQSEIKVEADVDSADKITDTNIEDEKSISESQNEDVKHDDIKGSPSTTTEIHKLKEPVTESGSSEQSDKANDESTTSKPSVNKSSSSEESSSSDEQPGRAPSQKQAVKKPKTTSSKVQGKDKRSSSSESEGGHISEGEKTRKAKVTKKKFSSDEDSSGDETRKRKAREKHRTSDNRDTSRHADKKQARNSKNRLSSRKRRDRSHSRSRSRERRSGRREHRRH